MTESLPALVREAALEARRASRAVAKASPEVRQRALREIASAVERRRAAVLARSEQDVANATGKLGAAMLDRLDGLDLGAMKIRQRVRAAVQVRLEAQQPYKEAARAMTRA